MADEDTTQAATSESTPLDPAQETSAPVETPSLPPESPVVAPTEQPAVETPTAQMPASEPLPPEPGPSATPTTLAPPPTASATQNACDLLTKANAARQDRKRKKLDKILEAMMAKGKITNDEVEKLLHVSDATATRYLSELEKQGKVKQIGKTGHAVSYAKI